MALTTDQIKPLLAGRVRDALASQAPETNRTGWMMRLADVIGVAYSTIQSWCYGETTPDGASLIALFDYFGPGFEATVRQGISPTPPEQDARCTTETLDEIQAVIDRRRQNIVPIKGKVS